MTTATTTFPGVELDPRRWRTLIVLCMSLLIVSVGNTSLNVALPTLSEELHASSSQLQWAVASYSLLFAGLLFTAGALGDRFGRKGTLQIGLVTFLVCAALASQVTSMSQLIACRAGMGAALIMPSTLSILVNVFPPAERTKAIAIWAATAGCSAVVGPLTSGLLLQHFWYGSVFLVNVPIILGALISGRLLVPRSRDPRKIALDPVGAVLSTLGITSLVYGLIQAPEQGWLRGTILGAFAAALAIVVIFVLWERRLDEPMLDIALFRNPAFSAGSGGMVVIFLSMHGWVFLTTQYFQLVLGVGPLGAALRFLPQSPSLLIVATLTPRLTARFGAHRTVAAGLALLGAGMLLFRGIDTDTSYLYVFVGVAITAGGVALAMSPMTASIMSAVPIRRAGTGSAMNDATREIGAALGVAVFGSIVASRYTRAINDVADLVPAGSRSAIRSSLTSAIGEAETLRAALRDTVTRGAEEAFVDGVRFAVTVGAALCALAAIAVLRYLPHAAVQRRSPSPSSGWPSSASPARCPPPPSPAADRGTPSTRAMPPRYSSDPPGLGRTIIVEGCRKVPCYCHLAVWGKLRANERQLCSLMARRTRGERLLDLANS